MPTDDALSFSRYVELLDKYFGSVCELDIIFNFEKAYFMLDELLLGGEVRLQQIEHLLIQSDIFLFQVQETSKKNVLKAIAAQDLLQEVRAMIFEGVSNNFLLIISFLVSGGDATRFVRGRWTRLRGGRRKQTAERLIDLQTKQEKRLF